MSPTSSGCHVGLPRRRARPGPKPAWRSICPTSCTEAQVRVLRRDVPGSAPPRRRWVCPRYDPTLIISALGQPGRISGSSGSPEPGPRIAHRPVSIPFLSVPAP